MQVLADGHDPGGHRLLDRRVVERRALEFGEIGAAGRHLGDRANDRLEVRVAGHEIGLGIDLDGHADPVPDRDADEALGRRAAGLLRGLGQTLGAQPVDGRLHVAAVSVSAFLASIMPAPDTSRSSFTIVALIDIIALLHRLLAS